MKKLLLGFLVLTALPGCAAKMSFDGFGSGDSDGLTGGGTGPQLYVQSIGEGAVVCETAINISVVCKDGINVWIAVEHELAGNWIADNTPGYIMCDATGHILSPTLPLQPDTNYRITMSQDLGTSSLSHQRHFSHGPITGCAATSGAATSGAPTAGGG